MPSLRVLSLNYIHCHALSGIVEALRITHPTPSTLQLHRVTERQDEADPASLKPQNQLAALEPIIESHVPYAFHTPPDTFQKRKHQNGKTLSRRERYDT